MATNSILPWAQTGSANVLSDTDYATDLASGGTFADGVKTGQASSKQANKTWRQATAPASGLGQFLTDNLLVDVTDADTPSTFSTRIANAVLKLAQISNFNSTWANAAGGYKKYAIVSDSSGNFWVSTADGNTTVPGVTGANWQSLFNGYATQSWVVGHYLPLSGGTLSSSLTVDGDITCQGIFWGNLDVHCGPGKWLYADNLKSETENASINILSNMNAVSGVNLFFNGASSVSVPDITAFTGTDALNAGTAERRYVKSVPATGQTRITDLVENSDGRAVFGDGTNNSVLANLADVPTAGTITGGTYTKTPMNDGTGRSVLTQSFTVQAAYGSVISLPITMASADYQIGLSTAKSTASGSAAHTLGFLDGSKTTSSFVFTKCWLRKDAEFSTSGNEPELQATDVVVRGIVT